MELWGAGLFGDPCRDCSFDWSLSPSDAMRWMTQVTARFASTTQEATGLERLDGWSVAEYVCHVGDNLRQWAERVQAARLAHAPQVTGYDPDGLAHARNYAAIPLPVAIWSLRLSAEAWCTVLNDALTEGVVLAHATRGLQTASDIARNNTHDAYHHLWDVNRILVKASA